MMVGRKWISTAMGLLAAASAVPALGQAPAPAPVAAPSPNQAIADSVAAALRSSRSLAGYRIEIQTRDGLATLTGKVATPAQKMEAIVLANKVKGIGGVIDQIKVVNDSRVRPAQYQVARGGHVPSMGGPINGGMAPYSGAPMAGGSTLSSTGAPMAGGGAPMVGSVGATMGGPISYGDASAIDGPAPEGPAGASSPGQAYQSGQPNYAWPSYAPPGNFSAVGYPTAYPWQAWPNIGPFYPYPEVPLDWRAVTLRWDDGIWWLDFKKHYTRPFFTPYPFGIFAY